MSESAWPLVPTEIGERIRALRGTRTQGEFAEFVGASRVSVVRYEAGTRTPDAEFVVNLCRRTSADPMWVLTGDGAAPKEPGIQLSAEEQLLLDLFRDAPKAVRKAALGALVGAAAPPAPGPEVQQVFHGEVGQAVRGNASHQVFHVGRGEKRKKDT